MLAAAPKAVIVSSASFGAFGPIFFLGFSTLAQILHPADNPVSSTVSFLVFGSFGWLQTSAFYVLGASLIALSVALVVKINAKVNLGAIVIFLSGIAFILIAGNPVQNSGTAMTISEIVHRDAAIAIVAMSPLACFLLAPNLKASGYPGLWRYSIIAGIISLLTIAAGFLVPAPTTHSPYLGIFARLLLLNGQLWGEIVCLTLIWSAVRSKRARVAARV